MQADNAQLVRSTGANVSVMLLQDLKSSPQKSRPLESGHRRYNVWLAIEYSYKLGCICSIATNYCPSQYHPISNFYPRPYADVGEPSYLDTTSSNTSYAVSSSSIVSEPFILKLLNGRIKICAGCKTPHLKSADNGLLPPFDTVWLQIFVVKKFVESPKSWKSKFSE